MYYDRFEDALNRDSAVARRGFGWAGCIAGVLLSLGIFLVNTNHGIGILVDSTRYFGLKEYPYDAPLYVWILQAAGAAGLEADVAAKFIGFVLVGANTALIWHLLMRVTGEIVYTLFGTLVIILSPQFVGLHSSAMSEPPFLLFLFVTLFAFLRYLETGGIGWLIASALALGAATLTRFSAPPLGAAIAICILLRPAHTLGRRVRDVAAFTIISASVFLTWVVASQLLVGRSIGRDLWFYGNMGAREWLASFDALLSWLLPDRIPLAVRVWTFVAFIAAAAVLTIAYFRRALRLGNIATDYGALMTMTLGLFVIFYLAFVVFSTSLEANLTVTSRYAFPAYVAAVLMLAIVLADLRRATGTLKLLHRAMVVLALIVLGGHTIRTVVRSEEAYRTGIGYAAVAWTNSPTMRALRSLPADAYFYSNGPDAILHVLKRPASFTPQRVLLRTGHEDPANPLEQQLQELRGKLAQEHSFVVIFEKIDWRFYLLPEAELVQRLSLEKIAEEPDGRIYILPTQPQKQ